MTTTHLRRALYLIRRGDTLRKIAKRSSARGGWRGIARDNKLPNPNIIKTGQLLVLYIPVISDISDQTTMVADGSLVLRQVAESTAFN